MTASKARAAGRPPREVPVDPDRDQDQDQGPPAAAAAVAALQQTVDDLADLASRAGRPGARQPGQPAHPGRSVSSRDVLEALAGLRAVQDQLALWEPLLIGAARDRGASWAAIAPALGLASRQAAERRYLRLNAHTTDPSGMTGEQRVQAARGRRAGDRAVSQWAQANAARLRQLAGQVTALDGLTPDTKASVDRVLGALGDTDSTTLLSPLAEAGAKLEDTHPALAEQIADVNSATERLRNEHTRRPS